MSPFSYYRVCHVRHAEHRAPLRARRRAQPPADPRGRRASCSPSAASSVTLDDDRPPRRRRRRDRLPALPRQGAADRRAVRGALDEIVALADAALERDDAWPALVEFIERGSEFQANNRALRQLLLGSPAGAEFAQRGRELLRPRVAELVRRARESGELRDDIETIDVPLIQLMVATIMDITSEVAPETWRRMLAIVIDGLRTRAPSPRSCRPPRSTPRRSPARWSTSRARANGRLRVRAPAARRPRPGDG